MDVIRQLPAHTVGCMEWFHMHFLIAASESRGTYPIPVWYTVKTTHGSACILSLVSPKDAMRWFPRFSEGGAPQGSQG